MLFIGRALFIVKATLIYAGAILAQQASALGSVATDIVVDVPSESPVTPFTIVFDEGIRGSLADFSVVETTCSCVSARVSTLEGHKLGIEGVVDSRVSLPKHVLLTVTMQNPAPRTLSFRVVLRQIPFVTWSPTRPVVGYGRPQALMYQIREGAEAKIERVSVPKHVEATVDERTIVLQWRLDATPRAYVNDLIVVQFRINENHVYSAEIPIRVPYVDSGESK